MFIMLRPLCYAQTCFIALAIHCFFLQGECNDDEQEMSERHEKMVQVCARAC